jgi:formylglycine-generating enzyme required for sulfatase activity
VGAVKEAFDIGKYDVTVLQWCVFLNAVHVTEGKRDPRHLYPEEMLSEKNGPSSLEEVSSLTRKPVPHDCRADIDEKQNTQFFPRNYWSSMTYATLPITQISLDSGKRYCNWLHHGAPRFDELNESTLLITETGAYDFTNGKHGELMPGARYFIPSLHQWYKAAYYQAFRPHPSYWRYPTQSNGLPPQTSSEEPLFSKVGPKTGANYATIDPNPPYSKKYYLESWYYYLYFSEPVDEELTCYNFSPFDPKNCLLTTPVGSFKDSPGPYGTYDMGGNVRQWTSDVLITEKGTQALAPGGSYDETSDQLLSIKAIHPVDILGGPTIGLRVGAMANISNDVARSPEAVSSQSQQKQ